MSKFVNDTVLVGWFSSMFVVAQIGQAGKQRLTGGTV